MSTIANLMVKIGSNVDGLVKGLNTAGAKIKETEKQFEGLQRVSAGMKSAGKSLSLGLTLPIVAAGAASLKMSTDFNKAMANVATLIPGNINRVEELKSAIQDMSVDVNKNTGDLAVGLYETISAFEDTSDTVKILDINARAATAGVSTVKEALKLTSAVAKGFNDKSAEMVQKASDLAFTTVKLGQTTFPELSSALMKVTNESGNLGVSLEEMFGVFAAATGVTGTAAEVSTQLASAYTALNKPSKELTTVFERLGVKSGKLLVEQRGLQGAFKSIATAANATGKSIVELVGTQEAAKIITSITGAQAEDYANKLNSLQNSVGATDEAFKEQTEGINAAGFAWGQFTKRLQVTTQQIGDELSPVLKNLLSYIQPTIDYIQSLIKRFGQLDPKMQVVIMSGIGLAAALGPVLTLGGNLLKVVRLLSIAFKAKTYKVIASKASLIAHKIATASNTAATKIATSRQWLFNKAISASKIVASTASLVAHKIAITSVSIATKIAAGTQWLLNAAVNASKVVGATIALIAHKVATIAVAGATKIATAAQWLFNAALKANPIGIVIVAVAALIAIVVLLARNWDKVSAFLLRTWNGLKQAAKSVADFISDAFGKASNFVTAVFNTMYNQVAGVINFLINLVNQAIRLLNAINIDLPDWLGGGNLGLNIREIKTLEMRPIPSYASGTNFHPGGPAWMNEYGRKEGVILPRGSQVIPSGRMNQSNIKFLKLADTIVIREEADIDKIGDRLVRKLRMAGVQL